MPTNLLSTSANACANSTVQHDRRRYPGATLTGAATPIWFVSVEVRRSGVLPRRRGSREIKTFATEAEAKVFARSKLDDGLAVFAGTINPYAPKRLVLSSQILAWLNDQPANNDPSRGSQ